MKAIAIPKGWRLRRTGTRERPTDRFRFRTEGGKKRLSAWTPLESLAIGKVCLRYLTIRKDA